MTLTTAAATEMTMDNGQTEKCRSIGILPPPKKNRKKSYFIKIQSCQKKAEKFNFSTTILSLSCGYNKISGTEQ